ncbi:MAG TPA: serine protease [Terriglobia bacterium]|nr:serine protease [Terriglobia bacterium]
MLKDVPVLLLLSIALGSGQATKGPPLTKAIKTISPAIVQIAYKMDHFPPETQLALGATHLVGAAGTGFVVNEDGYIVTALHVLNVLEPYQNGFHGRDGKVYPPGRHRLLAGLQLPNTDSGAQIRGSFSDAPFTVVDRDEIHDLALLKLDHPFSPQVPQSVVKLSIARPEEGSWVAVSGYPLGEDVLVTTSGAVASSWGSKMVQELGPGGPLHRIEDLYLLDIHLNHGNSGGPVYSPDSAAVIGVADAYEMDDVMVEGGLPGAQPEQALDKDTGRALKANAGLGVVVPTRYVLDLLKKNNVKWH